MAHLTDMTMGGTPVAKRAPRNEVEAMDDKAVRDGLTNGQLGLTSTLSALRNQGRDALADELEAEYAQEIPDPSTPDPQVEDDAPSDGTDAASEGDVEPDEVPEKFAVHEGAGWYSLSDQDDKMRGKDAVLEAGYTIVDED